MHELSIVKSIIDIAEQQARANDASTIDQIELEIGALSGIEMDALDFAWKEAVKHSMLADAERKINYIQGRARCMDCGTAFAIEQYYDACPVCGGHLLDILQGKELRVKSLLVS